MAPRRFSASTVIARDPADVFAWVADHRHASTVLDGVERWEPLGAATRGVGARFDVSMRALGLPLENVLVLDRWEEPRAIGWRSESGPVAQSGGWRFEPRREGTEVTLTIAYEPPGGLVGGLVAGRVDGLVRGRLEAALRRMKTALEEAV
ncbi:MAG TPA: SRPBCC family protein [Candidatus Dormibacteraeota bacterium]|nr:SRPBCC family protein [Candidatus Dormibacteraeota bacterium]